MGNHFSDNMLSDLLRRKSTSRVIVKEWLWAQQKKKQLQSDNKLWFGLDCQICGMIWGKAESRHKLPTTKSMTMELKCCDSTTLRINNFRKLAHSKGPGVEGISDTTIHQMQKQAKPSHPIEHWNWSTQVFSAVKMGQMWMVMVPISTQSVHREKWMTTWFTNNQVFLHHSEFVL